MTKEPGSPGRTGLQACGSTALGPAKKFVRTGMLCRHQGFVLTRRGFQRRSLGGLCVEVTVPVSPSFRFSPVGLDNDGLGLCVELVLPIVCPEESCPEAGPGPIACPEVPCPEEGLDAPPAFSAKDSVVVPAKRAIATAATAILRCILHSLSFADAQSNAQINCKFGTETSSAGFFALTSNLAM